MPEEARSKEFLINLIEFYKESLLGTSKIVDKLAQLQEKYPDDYEVVRQISFNPNALPEILERLDDTSRGILINIYLKQDTLSKKSMTLFQMSVEEKKTFSKELVAFGKYVDDELKKLMKENK